MGPHASADLVEIHWPSGIIQKLTNVAGDRILTVQEPPR
ncbi:MAG: ASPIC/UnbV domain-containing protein [Bryobacteraceae bacterium]